MDAKTPLINSDEVSIRGDSEAVYDQEGNTFPRMKNHVRRTGCTFLQFSFIQVVIAGILLGVSFAFPNGFTCNSTDDGYYDTYNQCSTGQTTQVALFITSMTLFGLWLLELLIVWVVVACQASAFDGKIAEMNAHPLMHWLPDREHWAKFVEAEYGPTGRQRASRMTWGMVVVGIFFGTAVCFWRLYWAIMDVWMIFLICFGANVVLWVSLRFIILAILTYRYRHMKNNIEKYHIVLGKDAFYFGRLYWFRNGASAGCGGQMKLVACRVVKCDDGDCAEFGYMTGGRRPRKVFVRFPVPTELLEPVKNWMRTEVLNGTVFVSSATPAAKAGRSVRAKSAKGARSSRSNPNNNRKAKRTPVVVNQATSIVTPNAASSSTSLGGGSIPEPSAPSPEPRFAQLSSQVVEHDEDDEENDEDEGEGESGVPDVEAGGAITASG